MVERLAPRVERTHHGFDESATTPLGFLPQQDPNTFIAFDIEPLKLKLSGGVFGLQLGNEHFHPSPFVSAEKILASTLFQGVPWSVSAKAGYLQLYAKLRGPEPSLFTEEIDSHRDNAANTEAYTRDFAEDLMDTQEFSRNWSQTKRKAFLEKTQGWSDNTAKQLESIRKITRKNYTSFEPYHLLFASLKAQIAKGYPLAGPVDIGAVLTTVFDGWANAGAGSGLNPYPNLQADATVGLRIHPSGSPIALGLFGGYAPNFSPFGTELTHDYFSTRAPSQLVDFHIENSHHWGVGFWGRVPGLPNIHFEEQSRIQLTQLTMEQRHALQLATHISQLPLEINGDYRREVGQEIEFFRENVSLGLNLGLLSTLADRVTIGVSGFHEDISFGGVNRGETGVFLLIGGEWDFGSVKAHAQSAFTFRPKPLSPTPPPFGAFADERETVFNEIRSNPSLGPTFEAYLNTNVKTREALVRNYCQTVMSRENGHFFLDPYSIESPTSENPDLGPFYYNPSLEGCMDVLRGTLVIDAILKITEDPELLNHLAMRVSHNLMLESLTGDDRNVGDVFAAGASIYNRPSPMPPLTLKDRRLFKEWALYHAAKATGFGLYELQHEVERLPYKERVRILSEWIRERYLPKSSEAYLDEGELDPLIDSFLDYLFESAYVTGNRELLEKLLSGEQLGRTFSITQGLTAPEEGRNFLLRAFDSK